MRTSKNQVFEVGNEKNVIKCKQFKFDIKNNEKPIALIGTIERKPSEREKEVLINFGFVVKRKDVFLVPSLGQSKVKLRKHASKSQVKVSEKNSP